VFSTNAPKRCLFLLSSLSLSLLHSPLFLSPFSLSFLCLKNKKRKEKRRRRKKERKKEEKKEGKERRKKQYMHVERCVPHPSGSLCRLFASKQSTPKTKGRASCTRAPFLVFWFFFWFVFRFLRRPSSSPPALVGHHVTNDHMKKNKKNEEE